MGERLAKRCIHRANLCIRCGFLAQCHPQQIACPQLHPPPFGAGEGLGLADFFAGQSQQPRGCRNIG